MEKDLYIYIKFNFFYICSVLALSRILPRAGVGE